MASASPGASDRASRVGTPHDAPQNLMQNPSAGFNPQQFGPNIMGQMSMNQMNMGHHRMPSGAMDPAQLYQRQLQQHLARQGQGTANGMSPGSQGHMGVKEQPPEQSGMPQPRMSQQPSPSEFFRGLQQFCAAKGRPLEMRPQICGRHVDAMRLYQALQRGGGSHRISKMNQWHMVAQALQLFQPQECRQAGMELQQYWMQNIGAFEQMWIQNQKMKQAQMPSQNSPTHDGQQVNTIPNHRRGPSDLQQISMNGKPPNQMNGLTPSKDPPEHFTSHQRQSQSEQLDALQTEHPADQTQQRPPSAVKQEPEVESTMPFQKPIEDPFLPEVMSASRNHGPINVEEFFSIGQHLIEMKPVVPSIRELGVVDIHALTMAIKSGMHGETRNALDTLVTLSSEPSLQIQLDLCDDLMETLVDCAQVELEFLADHASEVSDEVSLSSYEELVRSCNVEARTLQPIPAFGSLEYDLDRAADRLICITTLIRNFSFYEPNFATLGQQDVVQLVTRVIQHIGTKDMPLRTSRNTLDFMKDIIIYFSNLSSSLHLPSRQDALCVLHFLLTFAPAPPPISPNSDRIAFASYSPSIHKYLPPAVDSIAKLLARDEPNRMYFKAIFVADGRASIPYELLTRTFGLVVAPLPHGSTHLRAQIEARKPFLLQGMLAAEILASLAPGSENNLARSWLQSEDCFAGNMLKMASMLSSQSSSTSNSRQQQNNRNMSSQRGHDDDPLAHGSIVNRAMAVLRILVNKSRMVDTDGNTNSAGVPSIVVMKKETVLGAMIQKDVDANMLRLFCQYADLED